MAGSDAACSTIMVDSDSAIVHLIGDHITDSVIGEAKHSISMRISPEIFNLYVVDSS